MAIPVEEAIAALSTFSLEDEQPNVQGLAILLSTERCATSSPIEFGDVAAYRLSLAEDTKAINQLNTLIHEGREMASLLYTYRSCVKALPQLPDSMKHNQAELYLETYQVLDLEMSRLREIQRWQASAASKLAADMQRFSRPERLMNGPTITHFWSMLKLLDVLVQLDHLKNAKASIPNDFSWYKRTFTQVSAQWQDTDSMREELDDLQIFLSTRWAILLNLHAEMFRTNTVEDILQVLIVFCVESLELDFALLFPERHTLLRVLPVLVVLATSSEKESESLYKRVKINRLLNIFKNDPVIPAFPDLHLSPVAIMKELSMYFQSFSSQTRLLTLPGPHEIPAKELQEYPFNNSSILLFFYIRHYLIVNHIGSIRAEHDDFSIRFASALNQIVVLKSTDGADSEWSREVKGNIYDLVVEGFQLLSRWTGRVWEQCAWKFSRPCKEPASVGSHQSSTTFFDYEKVVRWNYTADERKALLEVIGYIKSVGLMMERCDTLVADALWETIHAEVQDFVQDRLDTMLRTTFRKKKDLSRHFLLIFIPSLNLVGCVCLNNCSIEKITAIVPRIAGLQEALPKSIGLLPFDGGIAGCQKFIHEQLTWGAKSELKTEVLHGLKEIGSALYWLSLLDTVLRQTETTQFMQTSMWSGLHPGADGQLKQSNNGDSPLVNLFKSASSAIMSNPSCINPSSFVVMSKQAEAADLLYRSKLSTGSVLEYALAFVSAALDRHYSKWSATPKTGFIDITTSKDFYRIFSGLQFEYLETTILDGSRRHEFLGDSVAWAGCTIIYLLGQQQHFELFDFSYQFLNVAEVESATTILPFSSDRAKAINSLQGYENLLEAMKKARRLNNHVFSMLRARCPLEDKTACAIKQSGAPLHRVRFVNTVSAFETLPQKGA
ncbi:protein PIR isoform X1 [Canna indica]|uniref:Protein PIR isoform X1 n=1 Tax=Canna indica TaxID=4628 RepID=A0AAQ3KPG6_9LILI|nr:protein PIR isoform X1 [Canna indica]